MSVPISTDPVYACPDCSTPLERRAGDHGVFWRCPRCGGRAVGLGPLKRACDVSLITRLWGGAHGSVPRHRPCPICGDPMREVTIPNEQLPTVDVCLVCQLVWFDPNEYEAFPATRPLAPSAPPQAPAVPQEARQAFAIEKVKVMAEQRDRDAGRAPEEWWKFLAGFFGMPVKEGKDMLHRPPWATWILAAVVSLVSCAAFFNLEHWIRVFGLIPAQADRYVAATLFTAFFLHAGVFHLVSNMYFLLVFGDNVEDALGIGRYLLLVFFAAAAGGAAHVALDPHRDIPVIGASAGIAGILAFYACRFPGVHLKFFVWNLFLGLFRWITIPAWAFFAFWIFAQALGAMYQISGFSSVSALGHLGGAVVGILFYLEWRFVAEGDTAAPTPGGTGG